MRTFLIIFPKTKYPKNTQKFQLFQCWLNSVVAKFSNNKKKSENSSFPKSPKNSPKIKKNLKIYRDSKLPAKKPSVKYFAVFIGQEFF
jgi:hypothetical protein